VNTLLRKCRGRREPEIEANGVSGIFPYREEDRETAGVAEDVRKLALMGSRFNREVDALLDLLPRWAQQRRDVRAVALVGSWAYRSPGPDSDLDVLLLTEEPKLYAQRHDWVVQLGGVALVTTRGWGALTERRFRLPSGLEVDLAVGRPSWASVTPVDDGTRRVTTDGLMALYDPDGLLGTLLEHCVRQEDIRPIG